MRERRGLRQVELAVRAGLRKQVLSDYELGKKHPSLKTLAKILHGLDVQLADLQAVLLAAESRPAVELPPFASVVPKLGLTGWSEPEREKLVAALDLLGFDQLPPALEAEYITLLRAFAHFLAGYRHG